jgi:hypothetical protein
VSLLSLPAVVGGKLSKLHGLTAARASNSLQMGAARHKAIAAVARQLAVDLWRIRTGRVNAEALGLVN